MTDRVGLEAVMNTRASMFGETIRTVFVSCVSFQQENEEKQDTLNAVSPTIVSQKKRVSSHITLLIMKCQNHQTIPKFDSAPEYVLQKGCINGYLVSELQMDKC
jgi:hypothetical protein